MFSVILSFVASHILYFALHLETSSFPKPLRPQEEIDAFAALKKGDMAARDRLIRHNLRLVAHIVKKYYSTASDHEDLISIGTIGLIKAVNSFDNNKGARFATYASRCIENAILSRTRAAPPAADGQKGTTATLPKSKRESKALKSFVLPLGMSKKSSALVKGSGGKLERGRRAPFRDRNKPAPCAFRNTESVPNGSAGQESSAQPDFFDTLSGRAKPSKALFSRLLLCALQQRVQQGLFLL